MPNLDLILQVYDELVTSWENVLKLPSIGSWDLLGVVHCIHIHFVHWSVSLDTRTDQYFLVILSVCHCGRNFQPERSLYPLNQLSVPVANALNYLHWKRTLTIMPLDTCMTEKNPTLTYMSNKLKNHQRWPLSRIIAFIIHPASWFSVLSHQVSSHRTSHLCWSVDDYYTHVLVAICWSITKQQCLERNYKESAAPTIPISIYIFLLPEVKRVIVLSQLI